MATSPQQFHLHEPHRRRLARPAVQGFSFTKETTTSEDEHYESDGFSVGGYVWAVRYYATNKRGLSNYRVALVLRSHLPRQGLGVRFAMTPLCKSGSPSDVRKEVTAKNVPYASVSGARE
ncbi:hypothetical protein ACP4OV_017512 [Aristida adscensionis]